MNTLVFFCDIRGTINSKNGEATIEELQLLLDYVNNYALSIDCSKVIFSLISSDDANSVLEHFLKLSSINSPIHFGKQFSSKGCFYLENGILTFNDSKKLMNAKMGLIKDYVDELKKQENIKAICYADDSNNLLYDKWLKRLYEDLEIYNIKPSSNMCNITNGYIETCEYGLDGVISGLDYFTAKKTVKTKTFNK